MSHHKPTVEGFQKFVTNVMQIPETALPVGSEWISEAFHIAHALVYRAIRGVSPLLYREAVYNLAASILIQYCPDQPGYTFFADYRKSHGIGTFTPGVISSSSDNGTSQSWLNADFMKNLTLSDLDNLKNPYGLAYLKIAQDMGAIWGLT